MDNNHVEPRNGIVMICCRPKGKLLWKYKGKTLDQSLNKIDVYLEFTALTQYHISNGLKFRKKLAAVSKKLKYVCDHETLKLRHAADLIEEEDAATFQYIMFLK